MPFPFLCRFFRIEFVIFHSNIGFDGEIGKKEGKTVSSAGITPVYG